MATGRDLRSLQGGHESQEPLGALLVPSSSTQIHETLGNSRRPMDLHRIVFCAMALLAGSGGAYGQAGDGPPPKIVLNYDESKVAPYELPPLMVLKDGKPIKTTAQWRTRRQE